MVPSGSKIKMFSILTLHRARGNKETLAKMAGDITESLISLNRTMASQVQHSEATMTTLGNQTFFFLRQFYCKEI